ncbi:MAG: PAS domain S-box protein [Acidobacteria bacterium]|nr:PAS domain S-box protein [Acidobacteriota bacterium]
MDNIPIKILLVGDNHDDYLQTSNLLTNIDDGHFDLQWTDSFAHAIDDIRHSRYDVYLIDYQLGQRSGLALLREAQQQSGEVAAILLTGMKERELDVQAMQAGAFDYLVKGELDAFALERSIRYAVERSRAETRCREAHQVLQSLLDSLPTHIAILDAEGTITLVNAAWQRFADEHTLQNQNCGVGANYLQICEATASAEAHTARAVADGIRKVLTGQSDTFTLEYSCPHAAPNRWFQISVSPFVGRGPRRVVLTHEEITKTKEAEASMRESEDRYRDLVENSHDLICTHDLDGTILSANHRGAALLEYDETDILHKNMRDFVDAPFQELFDDYLATIQREGAASGRLRVRTKSGKIRILEYHNTLRTEGVSAPIIRGMSHDITEKWLAEKALRYSEQRYRALFENNPQPMWVYDLQSLAFLAVNQAAIRHYGYSREEFLARRITDLLYSDDIDLFLAQLPQASEEAEALSIECRQQTKERQLLDVQMTYSVLIYGDRPAVLVLAIDQTERKKLEQQLRQSQKMEAVGRLAGGVAHDFNNLLTAIIGYADLLLMRAPEDKFPSEYVQEIRNAGERAATLTAQLLAFSRKQVLQPQVLQLNDLLHQTNQMLRRLIGEDIKLMMKPDEGLWEVKADPGQMDQIVINLVVNARDAMPKGGVILIETANLEIAASAAPTPEPIPPGQYVMLAFRDTGLGIAPEILPNIFEPFFTTKGIGQGTGLGLATVYGIVKQSGGYISVHSEVFQGTTFKVYLPRHLSELEAARRFETDERRLGGSETILLVEDEPAVRLLALEILNAYGYTVLEAEDGAAALKICETYAGKIDLVLTDVIMPNMSGRDLGSIINRRNPEIKVLYMSGYTDDVIARHEALEPNLQLIQKPFTADALARRIRKVLRQS